MKNEFILAFNEICESRGLPKEDVFDALKTALISAYRRDTNVSNIQKVSVDIDVRTGESIIYAEKEVVEEIFDNRTEVLLSEAHRQGHKEAQLGDLVMVDSTTSSFGRIAAQTAKQVLLQRVREAEREQLFEDFSGREGELVNGTVQSVSGQHITIGLGRTEALLPRSQQVSGERYRAHDKIRVYVLEVRRTNRGPQIFVSRNHRNLLRRLLELEVPEIYNGQVEIKSIAREAGQRSKVAVQALQAGVDPVGACVGMRGVRIQSIVRELNDEKIDVIEWDPNHTVFIAKSLSPARVSHVFLEEHPEHGKTAVVIVPDDQLSLAIGREGQNARLAAKLTNWRIDIKSLTEAASDSLNHLNDPNADSAVVKNTELIEQVKQILAKKTARRPITSEDYHHLDRFVMGVEGKIIATRAASYEEIRKQKATVRRQVPESAWKDHVEELDLPLRIHNLLMDNSLQTVGDVLYNLAQGDNTFLRLPGFTEQALETVKERVELYHARQQFAQVESGKKVESEVHHVSPATAVPTLPEPTLEDIDAELLAAVAEVAIQAQPTAVPEPEPIGPALEPEVVASEPALLIDDLSKPLIDDLSKPLVNVAPAQPAEQKKPAKPSIVVVRPTATPVEEEDDSPGKKGEKGHKGRQLIYDENIGEVVSKRKRKGSRGERGWKDFDFEDDF